jgi:hypothetical protein
MLRKKIEGQPNCLVIQPPSSGLISAATQTLEIAPCISARSSRS